MINMQRSETSSIMVVVRHGETEWNATHRLQGRTDIPLNEKGRKQISDFSVEEIKRLLGSSQNSENNEVPFDALVTSPLKRAKESCEIIQEAFKFENIEIMENLKEWSAGVLEGYLVSEIPKKFPEIWDGWKLKRDPDYNGYNGESANARFARVVSALESVADKHMGKVVVVVAHGCVIDDFFRKSQKLTTQEKCNVPIKNGGVQIIRLTKTEDLMFGWNVLYWQGIDLEKLNEERQKQSKTSDNPDNIQAFF